MEHYPQLIVDSAAIRQNAAAVAALCTQHGVRLCGVIKGAGGDPRAASAMWEGGCTQLASSRLDQLRAVREVLPQAETLLIRMPQLWEAPQVVRLCDASVNTEQRTLLELNAAAGAAGVTHGVILMYEVGDLREGAAGLPQLLELAALSERLPHLHLLGVGCTLGDICAVVPDRDNLGELCRAARAVEEVIGRPLEVVSGGSTTTLPLLLRGELPGGINHLRVGEAILTGRDLALFWGGAIPGTREDTLTLRAQVIETNVKPDRPWGVLGPNGFGETVVRPAGESHLRRRAILALGRQDVGDVSQLLPLDPGVRVIAASSDHLIVDTEDCEAPVAVGEILSFRMQYQGMLYAFLSRDVEKIWLP